MDVIAKGAVLQVMTGEFFVILENDSDLYIEIPDGQGLNPKELPVPLVRIFVDPVDVLVYLEYVQELHPNLSLQACTFTIEDLFLCDSAWGSRIEICSMKYNQRPKMIDLLFDVSAPLN